MKNLNGSNADAQHAFAGMDHTRRAKIVGTLGPSCSTPKVFRDLVRAGLDVARLNFSHGSHAQKAELIQMVRAVSKEERKPICILADLQGPKIRTGKLKGHKPVLLTAGKRLTITPREMEGSAAMVGTTFKTLAENLEHGSRILLSDGLIELYVDRLDGLDVVCEIVNGGMLGENKGINLPGIPVKVPSLTEKDEEDLIFAIDQGVDTVAVSFVRNADDVRHVKNRLVALNSDAWIIAKLEKPQAIDNLDSILEVADVIMVARGDLGVEVPPEKVPAIQKHIIRRAAEYRRPVITATQMLESMIENPRSLGRRQCDLRRHGCGDALGRVRRGQVSGRISRHDGEDRRRDRVADTQRPATAPAPPAHHAALRGGDDLRVHGALGGGPRTCGDRHLHGVRHDGSAALEVPAGATDLRALAV
jgi:pyruvate kinase